MPRNATIHDLIYRNAEKAGLKWFAIGIWLGFSDRMQEGNWTFENGMPVNRAPVFQSKFVFKYIFSSVSSKNC